MEKQKRIRLNAEKRKSIADVFQSWWEREDCTMKQKHNQAIETFNLIRPKIYNLVNEIVRHNQPQTDVDTIRQMRLKYNDSGGDLHHDSCFNFVLPQTKVDDRGEEYEADEKVNIDFSLEGRYSSDKGFANSYFRDELKAKGLDPDYKLKWADEKRNPRYYEHESSIDKYLGFQSDNDVNRETTHRAKWESDDWKIWVIGTHYCGGRQFKVNEETYKMLCTYNKAKQDVIKAHENLFDYVEKKMQKLRLGLKAYNFFDQAKKLADNLGIPLNESVLNESSSMALSVYNPDNLASLLEDKVEQTREEKIAIARQLMAQQVAIN